MREYPINIDAEIKYAADWAFLRNPEYGNFDNMGGDCTNFISQCLHAGGAPMNYTRDTGWYYNSLADRAAAWTSVEYLYFFLINNKGIGPFAHAVTIDNVRAGDIIQLAGKNGNYHHSLLVINMRGGEPHVCAHTRDVYDIPISLYSYEKARCLSVKSYRA